MEFISGIPEEEGEVIPLMEGDILRPPMVTGPVGLIMEGDIPHIMLSPGSSCSLRGCKKAYAFVVVLLVIYIGIVLIGHYLISLVGISSLG